MFAVMIGNKFEDSIRIKRTVSLLQSLLNSVKVDKAKLAGICHDVPDIEDLLTWFTDIDNIMNTVQHADTEV